MCTNLQLKWITFNLGKLVFIYFASNIVEGVAETWLEDEMSWVEVDGAGWMLK